MELTAARAAARERHAAEERQFEEMLARLQGEPDQPDKREPAKKEPNPTRKRKVLASDEGQVHREIILQHIFGNEDTTGTPECPTRKEPSTTPTGTPKRTPGLSPSESGMTGGRGGNGHGQVPLSWQEKVCRDMTIRAVDGTGASTTESTASTPRARTCPECEYSTPRDDNLRRHILAVHTEGDSARRIRELPGRWQAAKKEQQMRRDKKSKTPRGTKKNKKEQKTERSENIQ